jgi:hypothetical protein
MLTHLKTLPNVLTLLVFVWVISEAYFLTTNDVFINLLIFRNFDSGRENQKKVPGRTFQSLGRGGRVVSEGRKVQ